MVSTRSKTAQTHLEDFAIKNSGPKPQKPASPEKAAPKANTSRKRKSTDTDTTSEKQTPKHAKTEPAADDGDTKPTIINRAPVLHLWSACITHLTYPQLSWETCLSAGSAVSSICAVAKGRSIGTMPEKDEEAKQSKKKSQKKQNDVDEIEVMHFKLKIKGGLVVMGSDEKGKPGSEDALRNKFGDAQYQKAKSAFEDAIKSWKGNVEELNKMGFKMYEEFRPDVSKGQKGWGRKGELRLESVRSAVLKK